MRNEHICGHVWVKFGGRRRKCKRCNLTKSVHPRRRGRKKTLKVERTAKRVFGDCFTMKQLSLLSNLGKDGLAWRVEQAAIRTGSKLDYNHVPPEVNLVLIVDATWRMFKTRWHTVYVLAVKPVNENKAYVLPVKVLSRKENLEDWRQVLEQIPADIRKRIRCLVSDGFRGLGSVANGLGWYHQRCYAHLALALTLHQGKRFRSPTEKKFRDTLIRRTKRMVSTKDVNETKWCRDRILTDIQDRKCNKKLAAIILEATRSWHDFRTYLNHPELNIPRTSNTVESWHKDIQRRTNHINTPTALQRWVNSYLYFHDTRKCKSIELHTQN
jgi:hypothetical protein